MNKNEDLFKKHLEALKAAATYPENWLSLFTKDAVVEFPYAKSVGSAERLSGYSEIKGYLNVLIDSGLTFEACEFSEIEVYNHVTPDSFTVELKGYIPALKDKPEYRQHYICLVKTKDGKISNYKEFWNPTAVAAFL